MVEELPVVDLELGAKILDGDEYQAKDMIKKLISTLPHDLKELQNAYTLQDNKKLADIAHYLYGGACYCGTPRFKAAAKALEVKAKNAQSVDEIQLVYIHLCEEIEALIEYRAHL